MKPTFILENGVIKPLTEKTKLFKSDKIAYEVIRIIDGIPLFIDDHIKRLFNSISMISISMEEKEEMVSKIVNFIGYADMDSGNLRIDASFNNMLQYCVYQIPHHYPEANDYTKGVDVASMQACRDNPTSKIWNQNLRNQANQMISELKVREVLLVNETGFVTEGSRSNIFFIKNNTVYSAYEKDILPGVTRKYILRTILSIKGIEYAEENISLKQLSDFDSVFLSGTSLKVLPVSKINQLEFDVSNLLLSQIILKFDQLLHDYITSFKL